MIYKNLSLLMALSYFMFYNSVNLNSQQIFSEAFQTKEYLYNKIESEKPFTIQDEIIPLKGLNSSTELTLDKKFINELLSKNETTAKIDIPVSKYENVTLLLEEADFLSDDFIMSYSSSNDGESIEENKYFWGTVENQPNSIVSLTITKDEIISVIAYDGLIYNLGKLTDKDSYIIYEKNQMVDPPTTNCFSDDIVDFNSTEIEYKSNIEGNADNCVRMYVEVDNTIFQGKGANTASYIAGVFSQVSLLYANDGINLELSELKIWDTADPYNGPSTSDYLSQFRSALAGNHSGDLAHLVGYGGGGGIAYVNVICNSNYGFGYSGINSGYNNVPSYSWTVEVLTHEIGHNLGSPHTHDCSWNGNNTQIDDCGNQYYVNAGNTPNACYDANNVLMPVSGSIMSYCHLISGVGIDFNNGFGIQPGNRIRNNVYNSTCLTSCGSCEPNASCNDNNPCTINDTYDTNCNCSGTLLDSDNDGICDSQDACPGYDDTIDVDNDGVPDGCDDCINLSYSFSSPNLTHTGTGSKSSTVTLATYASDVSFSISNIDSKTNGNPSRKYIEKVQVRYVNGNGQNILYGTYLGTQVSSASIIITDVVASINVSITDGLDGNTSAQLSINISDVSLCPTDTCPDSDNDGVCNADDICPDGDDNIDNNGNGVPDACESNCNESTASFTGNQLTHSGSGTSTNTLSLASGATDVTFTISNIGSKINGNPNGRYTEQVTVSYRNSNGTLASYGTYSGSQNSTIPVTITGSVSEVIVSLTDAYDGNSSQQLSINFSTVEYCLTPALQSTADTNLDNPTLSCYPNPFNQEINVSVKDSNSKFYDINVYDIWGRRIKNQRVDDSSDFRLDLREATEGGMYILEIITDKNEKLIERITTIR